MMKKERLYWIDAAKGLCMIFVMISHASPPYSWVSVFTPFFLPCFFFLSGYTFRCGDNFKSFFIRKLKSLVLPMIMLSLVNGVVGVVFKGVPFTNRLLGIVIQQAGGYESLWFFPCLFVCEILFYAVVRIFKNDSIHIVIVSCLIAAVGYTYIDLIGLSLPWQFELACINVLFLCYGYIYKYKENEIDNLFNKPIFSITLIIAYLMLCLCYDNDVNMHEERFGVQVLFVIEAIIGVLLIVELVKKLPKIKMLNYIGTHTIVYFSFQGFLLQTIRGFVMKLSNISGGAMHYRGDNCFANFVGNSVCYL